HSPNPRHVSNYSVGNNLKVTHSIKNRYPSRIEKIDYEEGKMLVHFERWSHRYDEWIYWDSNRLRPLERPSLRKEGLKDEEDFFDFKAGEEVLARWTDCRYYPAKIEAINKEGTFTVQFYDGVIRCLKRMHIKAMPEDVKAAAAAAAKNKTGNKPRTSANSNKEKEKDERKWFKVPSKKEETPASVATPEVEKKKNQESRLLDKISSKLPANDKTCIRCIIKNDLSYSGKLQTQKKNEADIISSANTQKPALLSSTLSSVITNIPYNIRGQYIMPFPTYLKYYKMNPACVCFVNIEDFFLGSPQSVSPPRPSKHSERRRRSQRLATLPVPDDLVEKVSPPSPATDGKVFSISAQSQQATSVPEGNLTADKEDTQMLANPSSKAVPDGRGAPTASALDCVFRPDPCRPPRGTPPMHEFVHRASSIYINIVIRQKDRPVYIALYIISLNTVFECRVGGILIYFYYPFHFLFFDGSSNDYPTTEEGPSLTKPTYFPPKPAGISKTEKKVKLEEKSSTAFGKRKEKDKERREKRDKDHYKPKQKKKKKKKKKSKQHAKWRESHSALIQLSENSEKTSDSLLGSLPNPGDEMQNHLSRRGWEESEGRTCFIEGLSEHSLKKSLLLSGDEYNQDFDSTNFEESQDEDDALNEIVRCICEMDEENGFMIQCDECLCWQHSVCLGLLEESVPEQYTCYVCRDPPGQRWSAKYRHDKDWLNNGRMCGLSFVKENYSHLNAKKIVSTHHLLADVYGVTEVLHGLQLKIGILKNKHHPDLHLWACSGKRKDQDQVVAGAEKKVIVQDTVTPEEKKHHVQNHKELPRAPPKVEGTYITSEHSYQKPPSSGPDCRALADPGSSEEDDVSSCEEEQELYLRERRRAQCPGREDGAPAQPSVLSLVSSFVYPVLNPAEKNMDKKGSEDPGDAHLQWQLNLLTHIENVQNEVTSRMDLIEKEVDVLESWLDFTGELEPPDPLTRLPQLKRHLKQLLMDMGKVQQIATLCSV
uniref:PHD finger protein 20 like 1 n=1 Tax=Myotis lucifugus TaxID=59463 RepID=G1NVT3_MYOLU